LWFRKTLEISGSSLEREGKEGGGWTGWSSDWVSGNWGRYAVLRYAIVHVFVCELRFLHCYLFLGLWSTTKDKHEVDSFQPNSTY
jgi:hypothetical protein